MSLPVDDLAAQIPGLLRYAVLLTRDPDDAADLVQDTLVRALESAQTFRGESSISTWLRRILHHRYVDGVRRRTDLPLADEALAQAVEAAWREDAYTVDAAAVIARAELLDDLSDALARLPASARAALLLHDVEGLTAVEVADLEGIGVAAAKGRIRRGRAALISLLDGGLAATRTPPGVPLRCWDARSRVDDYIEDDLPLDDRARLERHLSACPTCPALYAALVGVRGGLARWRDRDPETVIPAEVAQRVRAHLAAMAPSAADD